MKEYKLDTNTHMGAWYISKRLCDKIIEKMNNAKKEIKKHHRIL